METAASRIIPIAPPLPPHQPMVGNANVPDFALGLGLQHRLIQSGAIARLGAERRRMKLIQINVVGPEVFQAGLQVLPKRSFHR